MIQEEETIESMEKLSNALKTFYWACQIHAGVNP